MSPGRTPLLDAEIALGFGDLRVRFEPGRLPGTVRLSLSDARVPLRLGPSDVRVARGLSLADLRVAPDLSGPRAAQRLEVSLLVLDVPEREADDLEAHVRHVGAGHLPHPLGEGLPVLVDLLHRQGAEHGALVPLEGLKRDLCDLIGALPEELLRRGPDRVLAAGNLHLRGRDSNPRPSDPKSDALAASRLIAFTCGGP